MSYHLKIKEKQLPQFRKDLRKFVKEQTTKKESDKVLDYKIQILPYEDQ